MKDNTWWS